VPKKVLIIDDDKDLAEVYEHKFKEKGFVVKKAQNGAWGLRMIENEKFDLVILDMAMPAMDGIEMLQRIKEKKTKEKPLVFALSNTALEEEMAEMRKVGADKCFIKIRVTPEEVFSQASSMLSEKNES